MEECYLIEPVQSLVPINSVEKYKSTISQKYWHIICKAQYIVALGSTSLKFSLFLIYYNHRLFLSILIEVIPMIASFQEDLEFPMEPPLNDHEQNESIPMPCGPIPLGYGVFELPQCPRCFFGYACNAHSQHEC